jgi:hypothetical protein
MVFEIVLIAGGFSFMAAAAFGLYKDTAPEDAAISFIVAGIIYLAVVLATVVYSFAVYEASPTTSAAFASFAAWLVGFPAAYITLGWNMYRHTTTKGIAWTGYFFAAVHVLYAAVFLSGFSTAPIIVFEGGSRQILLGIFSLAWAWYFLTYPLTTAKVISQKVASWTNLIEAIFTVFVLLVFQVLGVPVP